ncbi:hypothetical protein A3740_11250 [Oleiphilus sp. HI0068]|nr:hypothetical protein A3740_11250 [Oleiphilus sp. HI0068]
MTESKDSESDSVFSARANLIKAYLRAGSLAEAEEVVKGSERLSSIMPKLKQEFYLEGGESQEEGEYDREYKQISPYLPRANQSKANLFNVTAKEKVGQFYLKHGQYEKADRYLSPAFDFISNFFVQSANANNGFSQVVTALSAMGNASSKKDSNENLGLALGVVKQKLGKIDELEHVFAAAHEISCDISTRVDPKAHDVPEEGVFAGCMRTLYHYANLFAASGKHGIAKELYLKALKLQKKTTIFRLLAFSVDEKKDRDYLQWVKGLTNAAFQHAVHSKVYSHSEITELYLHLSNLKGQLLSIDSEILKKARKSSNPDIQNKYHEFAKISDEFDELVLSGARTDLEAYNRLMLKKAEARLKLKRTFAFNHPELFETKNIDQFLGAMSPDDVFIDIVKLHSFNYESLSFEGETYIAVVAETSGQLEMVNLGDAVNIDDAVGTYHATINNSLAKGLEPQKLDLDKTLESIYDLTLSKLDNLVEGKSTLLVNADGAFHSMPLSILRKNNRYLLEDYKVVYVQSRSIDNKQKVRLPESFVVVTDPDYNSPSATQSFSTRAIQTIAREVQQFSALPETKHEGEEISRVLRGKSSIISLTGKEASEANLRKVLADDKGLKALHIASHGFFLPADNNIPPAAFVNKLNKTISTTYIKKDNPMLRSGIALAGANDETSKSSGAGLLTASQFSTMDLDDVYLAVLSACNTGSGDIQSGEGVFGLQRGLLMAGVDNLVLSSWSIPSDETVLLMGRFYEHLVAGQDVSDALRTAQLDMLKVNSNPFFWGAFTSLTTEIVN